MALATELRVPATTTGTTCKIEMVINGQLYKGTFADGVGLVLSQFWNAIGGARPQILPAGTSRPANVATTMNTATRGRPATKKKRH